MTTSEHQLEGGAITVIDDELALEEPVGGKRQPELSLEEKIDTLLN